jgi:Spy/CpxP family protein refolding chaperone
MVMQIELSEEQAQALKKIADRKGKTVPELIVSSVDAMLTFEAPPDPEDLKRRALAVSGRFRSGLRDLSTEHDRYLEKAFGD